MNYLFTIKCVPIGKSFMNILVTRCSDKKEYSICLKVPTKCYDYADVKYRTKDDYKIIEELFIDMKEYDRNGMLNMLQLENTLKRIAKMVRSGYDLYTDCVLYINDEDCYIAVTKNEI